MVMTGFPISTALLHNKTYLARTKSINRLYGSLLAFL